MLKRESWYHHEIEKLPALLSLLRVIPHSLVDSLHKAQVMQSFDVSFDVKLKKLLNKQFVLVLICERAPSYMYVPLHSFDTWHYSMQVSLTDKIGSIHILHTVAMCAILSSTLYGSTIVSYHWFWATALLLELLGYDPCFVEPLTAAVWEICLGLIQ